MTRPESPDLEPRRAGADQTAYAEEARVHAAAAATRCVVLLRAIVEQFPNADASVLPSNLGDQLQRRIAGYAMALRVTNTPPDVTLIQIKQLIAECAGTGGVASSLLMQSAIKWAIEGYYRH